MSNVTSTIQRSPHAIRMHTGDRYSSVGYEIKVHCSDYTAPSHHKHSHLTTDALKLIELLPIHYPTQID